MQTVRELPLRSLRVKNSTTGAEATFERVFRRLGISRPSPVFQVEFHPFAGLRSTIHLHENRARVRIGDVLAAAPPLVLTQEDMVDPRGPRGADFLPGMAGLLKSEAA